MPLLSRRVQVALALEAVEGSAESLAAGDATMLVYNPTFNPNVPMFNRAASRASLAKLAGVPGTQSASVAWRTEFKGSGSLTTEPAWSAALQACGFQKSTVYTMAVTIGGTQPDFTPGETIEDVSTGGSGATGRVVGMIANTATVIHYVPITGTFATGDSVVGATSGAIADVTDTPAANKGFEYIPDSSSPPSATVGLFRDGLLSTAYGCRGSFSVSANTGEPVFLDFSFQGVLDGSQDQSMLDVTYETTVPLAFLNVNFEVDTYSACFSTFNFDLGNTLTPRTCATNAKGITSYFIGDRNPTGSIDPEATLVADYDWLTTFLSGNTALLYWKLPSNSAGQTITFALPKAQYTALADNDRGGIAVVGASFLATEESVNTIDRDVQIAVI